MLFLLLSACASHEAPATMEAKPAATGAAPAAPATRTAVANLEARSGSTVAGTVKFVESGDSVDVTIDLTGATPGDHAVHVHEKGDCSAADGTSAGGHYNPMNMPHGAPDHGEHHPGDFGNVTVGADGTGHKELKVSSFKLAEGDVSVGGRAVIVHEKPDDYSQPTGNAGARQACGVITVQ